MSIQIITRYDLKPDEGYTDSVRLTWRDRHDAPKTKRTRFWFRQDEDLRSDIVIGVGMDEPDPTASEGSPTSDEVEDEDESLAATDEESNADSDEEVVIHDGSNYDDDDIEVNRSISKRPRQSSNRKG